MKVSEFIDRLGGLSIAGRMYGIGPSSMHLWKQNEKIPWPHYLKTVEISKETGLEFDEAWFGPPRKTNGAPNALPPPSDRLP